MGLVQPQDLVEEYRHKQILPQEHNVVSRDGVVYLRRESCASVPLASNHSRSDTWGHSDRASPPPLRLKPTPTPLIIPGIRPLPAVPMPSQGATCQTDVNTPPAPSSGNLSALSESTREWALVANSFVLSAIEQRKSRHHSGTAHQDWATLSLGEVTPDERANDTDSTDSSVSSSPSPISPFHPMSKSPRFHPSYTPRLASRSSSFSENPISNSTAYTINDPFPEQEKSPLSTSIPNLLHLDLPEAEEWFPQEFLQARGIRASLLMYHGTGATTPDDQCHHCQSSSSPDQGPIPLEDPRFSRGSSESLSPCTSPESQSLSSRASSTSAGEASTPTSLDTTTRTRVGSRPSPGGPRKPSGITQQPLVPNLIHRPNSVTSVATHDHDSTPFLSAWPKLFAAASNPPPKFQKPAPKWRGMTLEAAKWTFTSDGLQSIVSRAIQMSSEGSSIRLLKPDVLEGEIADETHRLELQRTDVKAQYKALVRERWSLLGALAEHAEGTETNDGTTVILAVEGLAEVSLGLDQLAEKLHEIAEQLAQLESLREVHNRSALAMALQKMHDTFERHCVEKEQLMEQVRNLKEERDDAWTYASVAQKCDELNGRVWDLTGDGDSDAQSTTSDDPTRTPLQNNQYSARLSVLRKSSVRASQAGFRSRSRPRSRCLSFGGCSRNTDPLIPSAEDSDIPLVQPASGPYMNSHTKAPAVLSSLSLAGTFGPRDSFQAEQLELTEARVFEMES